MFILNWFRSNWSMFLTQFTFTSICTSHMVFISMLQCCCVNFLYAWVLSQAGDETEALCNFGSAVIHRRIGQAEIRDGQVSS